MNPIDIIATAIHEATCGCVENPPHDTKLATHIAGTLTDEAIVANAVQALHNSGWTDRDGVTAENIARTVLGSVGGAA